MTFSLRRGAIRAVLITGALATIATSPESLATRVQEARAATTERGLLLTVRMTPELIATARDIELEVVWSTGIGVSEPKLLVTPESDALEPLSLMFVRSSVLDDAGNPTSGSYAWRAYLDIEPACSGAGECTVRFWIAPEPGSNTADIAGTIKATGVARGHRGGDCEDTPQFPDTAVLTLTLGEIEAAP